MQSPASGEELPQEPTCAGVTQLKSSLTEKELMDTKLNVSQQCVFDTENANGILGCLRQTITCRLRKVNLRLYSALVGPHLEVTSNLKH